MLVPLISVSLPQRSVAVANIASTAPPMAKGPDPTPQTFEAALAELETIVATMEDGQLPLAGALAAYKRGAELLQYCQAALKDAQQQVQILERGVLKAFAPGEPDSGTNVADRSSPDESDAS
jgi:exodeoxyribonuclease VII small subunit